MLVAKLFLVAGMVAPLLGQTASEDQIAAHAQAAQDAERKNDFATAVREFQEVTKAMPESAEMQSNLGVALYFNHQLPEAIAVFRKAMTLNPSLLAPHLFSGLAWQRLSNPDAAAPQLEKAVSINPSDVIAHTWLGYAYLSQSRYEDAVKQFQTVCKLDPNNIDAWYALGQAYLQIGKQATRRLLAVGPDNGRVWQLAGEQFALQGNKPRALNAYEEALKRRPDIAELRPLIAGLGGTAVGGPSAFPATAASRQQDRLYRQAHDAEQQSRAAFERVVAIAPDSYRAHQVMADSFAAAQKREDAIREYRTVLQLKPDLPGIHLDLGKLLAENGKLPEALDEFEQEIQLQPRSAAAHVEAGKILMVLGKDSDAEKMLAAALAMDRPPADAYLQMGKLDLGRNNYAAAIAMLTRYVSTTKDNPDAYYLLSRAYRATGDKERMNEMLDLFRKTSKEVRAHSLPTGDTAAATKPEGGSH